AGATGGVAEPVVDEAIAVIVLAVAQLGDGLDRPDAGAEVPARVAQLALGGAQLALAELRAAAGLRLARQAGPDEAAVHVAGVGSGGDKARSGAGQAALAGGAVAVDRAAGHAGVGVGRLAAAPGDARLAEG